MSNRNLALQSLKDAKFRFKHFDPSAPQDLAYAASTQSWQVLRGRERRLAVMRKWYTVSLISEGQCSGCDSFFFQSQVFIHRTQTSLKYCESCLLTDQFPSSY